MKRLFVAVDLDAATRDSIASVIARIQDPLRDVRLTWADVRHLHLTVVFLGGVAEDVEHAAIAALADPLGAPAFDVTFAGFGVFPSRRSPRVLWLGVADGAAALRHIHDVLTARLTDRGGQPEPFTPHLTLARFRERVPQRAIAPVLIQHPVAGPCRIDRVTLYESRLSPRGATYVPVAQAVLS